MKKRILSLVTITAILAIFVVLPVSAEVSIPADISEFNGHYYYICDDGMTWYEAKAVCEEMGGHLATVTSAEEEAFIESLIESGTKIFYWLGGTDEVEEDVWTWITGEAWSYTNWDYNEPDDESGTEGVSEDYLTIYRNKNAWNDLQSVGDSSGEGIIQNSGYICEWDDVVVDDEESKQILGEFNGHTYAVYNDGMTWYEAKAVCEEMGGYLATITSAEEEAFIEGLIKPETQIFYWLGGTDEVEEGTWTWITGEAWSYTKWDENQPDDMSSTDGVSEDYLTIYRNREAWNDLQSVGDSSGEGTIQNSGYICEWGDVVLAEGQTITSFNSEASQWSSEEMEEAYTANLIPENLVSEDLTKRVSRSEFASIAVKLYEALSGESAPVVSTPFTDISQDKNASEIAKAYGLDITAGTSPTTFDPDTEINREQLAAMLCRTIKKYKFEGWTNETDSEYYLDSEGVKKFEDDADISDYAKQSVYYMAKMGIISGVDDTHFAPKNTTDEQEANGYATATREQAIALSLRIYKLSDLIG